MSATVSAFQKTHVRGFALFTADIDVGTTDASGQVALTAANVDMIEVFALVASPIIKGGKGYLVKYDKASEKLNVYHVLGTITGNEAGTEAIGIGTDANGAALSKVGAGNKTGITGMAFEPAAEVNLSDVVTQIIVTGIA